MTLTNQFASPVPLIERPEVQFLLSRLVCRCGSDVSGYEDLFQEAMLHLWLDEQDRPGHTLSWYFQSCRFHLIDLLRRGRSLDASKRRHLAVTLSGDPDDSHDGPAADLQNAEEMMSSIIAQDIVEELRRQLRPTEFTILKYLAVGFTLEEIARKLGVSRQAVGKSRRKIARLASNIGVLPIP